MAILRAGQKVDYPIRTKEMGAYIGDRRVRLGKHVSVSMFEVLRRIPDRNFDDYPQFKGAVMKHWNRIQSLATPRHRRGRPVSGRTATRRMQKRTVPRPSNNKARPSGRI